MKLKNLLKEQESKEALEMVRSLNTLANDIDKLKYQRQIKWAEANPRELKKIEKCVDILSKYARKMR